MAVVVPFCTQVVCVSLVVLLWAAGSNGEFARTIGKRALGIKREKLTHFKVYWHDVVAGPRPSAIAVVPATNGSTTAFGMVRMIDNRLTEGPDISSKLVGKAQGFYAQAAQDEIGLLMAMNLAFVDGKYNGSTLTVLGRNAVFNKVREMPIVGGSGLFRFARGYVQATTHTFDLTTGDATVEYSVYVLHY